MVEIILRYNAPVYVHVVDGHVTRVVVMDDGVEIERNEEGFAVVVDTTNVAPNDTDVTEAAAMVAEEDDWPEWVFMS